MAFASGEVSEDRQNRKQQNALVSDKTPKLEDLCGLFLSGKLRFWVAAPGCGMLNLRIDFAA